MKNGLKSSSGPIRLINLPPEILHLILCLLPAHTLSSLSLTCNFFNSYIDDFEICQHLWTIIGGDRWDLMSNLFGYGSSKHSDQQLRSHSSGSKIGNTDIFHSSRALDVGGNEKWDGKILGALQELDGNLNQSQNQSQDGNSNVGDWIPSQQIKRRSKAARAVKLGSKDEVIAILNHTPILQALLSALRYRKPRIIHPSHPNSSLPTSITTKTLSSLFPEKSLKGDERWSKFVYPRETLTNLVDWGERLKNDDPSIKSRARDPPPFSEEIIEGYGKGKGRLPERRSTRLSYNNYPIGLHSLLRNGLKPSEVDRLALLQIGEETQTLDEELAAQFHCLHGIREFSILLKSNHNDVDDEEKRHRKREDSFSSVEDDEDGTKKLKRNDSFNFKKSSLIPSNSNPIDETSQGYTFVEQESHLIHPSQTIISGRLLGITQQRNDEINEEHQNNQGQDAESAWYNLFDESISSRPFSLGSKNGVIGDSRLRTKARERCYDSSRFSFENGWGPFKPWRESLESFRKRRKVGDSEDKDDDDVNKEIQQNGKEREIDENQEDHESENDAEFVGNETGEEEDNDEEEESQSQSEEENQENLRKEAVREFSITPNILASPIHQSESSTSTQVNPRNIPSLASILDSAVEASMIDYNEDEDEDFQPEIVDQNTYQPVNHNQELVLDPGDPEEDELPTMEIFHENSDGDITVEEDDFFDDGSDFDDQDDDDGLHIGHFGQTMASLRDWSGSRIRNQMNLKVEKETEKKRNLSKIKNVEKIKGDKGKGKEKMIENDYDEEKPLVFQKTVDWLQVESIMIVTCCNLRAAINDGGWGKAFDLPIGAVGDFSAEPEKSDENSGWRKIQDETDHHDAIKGIERRRRILIPRSNFEHSRGEILLAEPESKKHENKNGINHSEMLKSVSDQSDETKNLNSKSKRGAGEEEAEEEKKSREPRDWAHVEGIHIGTYSFLDFSDFLIFNAALGSQAQENEANDSSTSTSISNPTNQSSSSSNVINPRSWLRSNTASLSVMRQAVSLEGKDEAVGDCLLLCLTLEDEDKDEDEVGGKKSMTPDEQVEKDLKGLDPNYPPLRFKGRTLTPKVPNFESRGEAHGIVRPVYSPAENIDSSTSGTATPREIIALHWTIIHRYDGEDRWRLELVQPGPPGSRSPMYGVWSDAHHDEGGPCGPASYYRVDSRKFSDNLEKA